ncbi:InlB B-repeat-containing protein, partial [Alkalimonas sp.]|uniref:InlB B-repeat-containing protein n=1 Tax=Alkalimonas sp. TaxID=1872453 RepID=UPI002A20BA3D|nr:InlB B-repeat-containing protein [Alkalimonas sp.]
MGTFRTGGLAGRNNSATIANSFATGNVSSAAGTSGGFAGQVGSNGRIENSYALGNVIRTAGTNIRFGGFVGRNDQGKILNSFATGSVSFDAVVQPDKGFVGDVTTGGNYEMTGNFWDTETSGASSTAGDATGKTSAEMKTQSTFTAAAWNFDDVWAMSWGKAYGGYPTLQWTGGFAKAPIGNQIGSLANLVWLAEDTARWSGHYTQTADINMATTISWDAGHGWSPIGTMATNFTGVYQGGGHRITNLFIHRPSESRIGLFGQTNGATISKLGLVHPQVTGMGNVGTLVGLTEGGTSISESFARGGSVNGSDSFVGGLVGRTFSQADTITNAYAQVRVLGGVGADRESAGLVGANSATLTNSYAAGEVRVNEVDVGFGNFIRLSNGLVRHVMGSYLNNFYDTDISGHSGNASGRTGKTTAEMRDVMTFIDWDFDDVWGIHAARNNGYPYLRWEYPPAEFEVTYHANGATGGAVPPAQVKVENVTLTLAGNSGNLERTGFTFGGWNTQPDGSGTDYAAGGNYTANEAVTLYAKWLINSYTVTFIDWDGTVLTTETVNHGAAATAPAAPSRMGHSFTGWSPSDFSNITTNTMVTAQYSVNSYTLSFDSAGGSAVAAITADFGAAITAPAAPTREGFSFVGWTPALPATMPATSQTHTAQWSVNSYTLSFDSAGGSAVAAITANSGTAINPPAEPTRLGYTFTGWEPALPDTMPSNDVTVTAQWSINQYTLSFDTVEGTDVAAITADFGSAISVPEPPTRAGFVFAGWQPELPATMPAQNQTHTAQWNQSSFTVTIALTGEGSVTPASQQVAFGSSASFDLSVAENTFVHVESNCAASRSGNKIITAMLSADCTISLVTYTAVELDVEDTSPAGSQEARRFRLGEGAGEQVLTALQQTRSGTAEWLDIA